MHKFIVRNKNNIKKCEYRAYCIKLTKIIRQAEIMHYNEILYNHHDSAQMLWKYFGKSLNSKRIRRNMFQIDFCTKIKFILDLKI